MLPPVNRQDFYAIDQRRYAAMQAFAKDPTDEAAAERLSREPSYVGTTRTTCVVTMLKAGHAENALPQSATATVNCRVFPGVPVSEIEATLRQVVGNDAVEKRYPTVQLLAYMESGGTDGMHFRRAGIPTWAVSGIFMNPDEMFAHGLNERVPIKAFYDALDHWSIIIHKLAGP